MTSQHHPHIDAFLLDLAVPIALQHKPYWSMVATDRPFVTIS